MHWIDRYFHHTANISSSSHLHVTCAISSQSSLLNPLDHPHWSLFSNHQLTPVSRSQTAPSGIRPTHPTCATSFLLRVPYQFDPHFDHHHPATEGPYNGALVAEPTSAKFSGRSLGQSGGHGRSFLAFAQPGELANVAQNIFWRTKNFIGHLGAWPSCPLEIRQCT